MIADTRLSTVPVGIAVHATYAAFIASGFAFATWASRIPQVRDRLGLDPGELGLVLLAMAAGAVVALPMAGFIVGRWGSRWTVTTMAVLNAVGLSIAGIGSIFGVLPVVIGLVFFGFAQGAWDVAMNVQGAQVERELGRSIMPRFHAGFSVGTVAGALLGAGVVALRVPVTIHLPVAAALGATTVTIMVRNFRADAADPDDADGHGSAGRRVARAWREPRTLMVGVFVLAFAFAEGVGNDWTSIAYIDDYGTSAAIGTLGFATFLTAMTIGRWFGPSLLDRYGRVVVVRIMAVISVLGVLIFVYGGLTPIGFLGTLLWGVGIALGFPVGMSAGADEPAMAAPRVSVIASVGYTAFLAGPPLIGFLGDRYTVLRAIMAVAVMLVVAIAVAGKTRPPAAEGQSITGR